MEEWAKAARAEEKGSRQCDSWDTPWPNEAETPTEPPSPDMYEKMGRFVEEATKAGVIVATGGIAPTSEGARISLKEGEYTVVDGPFAEAKELVGRLGAHGVPRPARGRRVVQALPRRPGRRRGTRPPRLGLTRPAVALLPSAQSGG